ncbi:MAG: PLP-dependent aspartate aminotransferase family protein [Lachnospiraceae bacterium]|nr:PLP-dependent aspartate aminotransferase family protein [Lachnospiraceae bacterium]
MSYDKVNTKLIHGGIPMDEYTGAVNVPVYLTSTFKQDGLGVRRRGYEYARTGNPTREALEALIAELDGGLAGFAFSSGLAAIDTVLSLFKEGDEILTSENVYGGTFRILDQVFSHFGIKGRLAHTEDPARFAAEISDQTKAVLIESPANPLMEITDIRTISDIAHEKGLTVIVDNTFMTPYLQKPIELGADIVVYSATKYLAGHSDLVAGLVVVTTEELKERVAFLQNSKGAVLPPFDSWLLIRGIKTLGVRLDRHVANAEKIAAWLDENSDVKTVYYPGLKNSAGYEINKKQARNGGAMMSFELTEDHDIAVFFEQLRLIMLAESLGGVESLICHPASMTHASIPKEIREKVGITDQLIRLSPGIEDVDDIIADLDQAIWKSRK